MAARAHYLGVARVDNLAAAHALRLCVALGDEEALLESSLRYLADVHWATPHVREAAAIVHAVLRDHPEAKNGAWDHALAALDAAVEAEKSSH